MAGLDILHRLQTLPVVALNAPEIACCRYAVLVLDAKGGLVAHGEMDERWQMESTSKSLRTCFPVALGYTYLEVTRGE